MYNKKKISEMQRAQDLVKLSHLCWHVNFHFSPRKSTFVRKGGFSIQSTDFNTGSKMRFILNEPSELDTLTDILYKYDIISTGTEYLSNGRLLAVDFACPDDMANFINKIKPKSLWGRIRQSSLNTMINIFDRLDKAK